MKHTISKMNYWVQHSIFFVSLIMFILNMSMLYTYDNYSVSFQYMYTLKFIGYYVYLGMDSMSMAFTLLTSFIMPLCLLFVWPSKFKYKTEYFICLFSMELLMMVVFSVLDLFWFFVLFEAMLIPFFLLIGLYGSRVRKMHAAYLLFFYTVLGSLLMLISIIYMYLHTGTTNMQLLWKLELDELAESLIWASFFLSFSVKVPIFPFHIWLPEAHVESPTEASVMLASILLKVGVYGFLSFLMPMFPVITFYYSNLIIVLNIMSILYTSFITLSQMDIKRMMAYSSVGHMNVCMLGMMSFDMEGMIGTLLIMFGHGMVSGGLFFAIGILYDSFKTKMYYYYSGLVASMPIFSVLFFMLMLGNVSLPLTCNFMGEVLILHKAITEFHTIVSISMYVSMFICTAYSFWLWQRICSTNYNEKGHFKTTDLSMIEFSIMMPMMICMFALGMHSSYLMELWYANVSYYYSFLL